MLLQLVFVSQNVRRERKKDTLIYSELHWCVFLIWWVFVHCQTVWSFQLNYGECVYVQQWFQQILCCVNGLLVEKNGEWKRLSAKDKHRLRQKNENKSWWPATVKLSSSCARIQLRHTDTHFFIVDVGARSEQGTMMHHRLSWWWKLC